jgi:bifunctional ADP-heptose synthase (sugar kinase/adenylyltransferase)
MWIEEERRMCHSFIIGDLVIDHTIFVKDTTADHQQKARERIFQVLRRTDTAGGAANCARILAALSDGETYLWGIIGKSRWGDFRSILAHAQAVDGSRNAIELRGSADETDAQMNTITRLIDERSGVRNGPRFGDRFDEYQHIHVTPQNRATVLYYLERACQKLKRQGKGKLDLIIINDLDYGCLTKEIVAEISNFADRNEIPLFVDPKYDRNKYDQVKGKAILPNLKEWCRLVGEREKEDEWRKRVRQSRDLSEMAYRSFLALGSFDYYVITCDEDGIVFIGPDDRMPGEHQYVICKIPSHVPSAPDKLDQLGSGDVLSAVFAMELDRITRIETVDQGTAAALKALIRASVVVACYREMPWHHMPSNSHVAKALTVIQTDTRYNPLSNIYVGEPIAHARAGIKYLPKEHKIALSEYSTFVPLWFSQDLQFCGQLQKLRAECLDTRGTLHITLGAPEGSGKSILSKFLQREARKHGIEFDKAPDPDALQAKDKTAAFISDYCSRKDSRRTSYSVLAVDEALKRGFEDLGFALSICDMCLAHSVRLLLIDTGFFTANPVDKPKNGEMKRRVSQHLLLPPNQRPNDIPLIIAGLILNEVPTVDIQGDFLLGFTCAMLQNPSVGGWKALIDEIVHTVMAREKHSTSLALTGQDLPSTLRKQYLNDGSGAVVAETTFTFSRGPNWPIPTEASAVSAEAPPDAA